MKKNNAIPTSGIVVGLVLIFWSINTGGGDLKSFFDVPSLIITLGGSFCAMLVSFPFKTLMNIPKMLKLLMASPQDDRKDYIILLTELARKSRKDGLLALEDNIPEIKNEFLASGLQMVVDGVEPDNLRDIMELKMETTEKRHNSGQNVFLKWGELAPAFGMLGTLIGLIVMLAKLDDPSSIGSGMAVALITTFYGSLFANLIFLPIASNLKEQTEEEMFSCQMIIDGILEIQAGTNPRVLEERLMTYLSPEEQKSMEDNSSVKAKEAGSYE